MTPALSRRSLLAAIPAAGILAAMPELARAAATAGPVTLAPLASRTLTFPLSSSGYTMAAAVVSGQYADTPFLSLHTSWPSGSSQRWTLSGSPSGTGQHYSGTGPVQGTGMLTVRLKNEDNEQPITVRLSFTPSTTKPPAHSWMQVTNRPPGHYYPLGTSDQAAGVVLRARTDSLSAGSSALWYVPLRNGPATLTVRSLGSADAQVLLLSLDPAADDDPFLTRHVRAGRHFDAAVDLPLAPCLLTINNGQHRGEYTTLIKA